MQINNRTIFFIYRSFKTDLCHNIIREDIYKNIKNTCIYVPMRMYMLNIQNILAKVDNLSAPLDQVK